MSEKCGHGNTPGCKVFNGNSYWSIWFDNNADPFCKYSICFSVVIFMFVASIPKNVLSESVQL